MTILSHAMLLLEFSLKHPQATAALRSSVYLTSRHHLPCPDLPGSWFSCHHNTIVWNSKDREVSNTCVYVQKGGFLSLLRPWCLQDTKTCEKCQRRKQNCMFYPTSSTASPCTCRHTTPTCSPAASVAALTVTFTCNWDQAERKTEKL